MKSISDISKILNEKIEKIIWALGLHAFLLILFLIIVDVVLGGFIFYKNVFLAEKEIPNTTQNIIKFNEKKYQDVSEKLNTTEQSIKEPLATDQSDTTLQVVTPIVTTSPYIFSGYLSYGSKGDGVLQLQKLLLEQGFFSETPNGNYDEVTVLAVKKFQQANNIKQTGNVGVLTRNALNKILTTPTN